MPFALGRFAFLAGALFALLSAMQVHAAVTFIGIGTCPGDASDLSGLKGMQSDGTPHNRLGGQGSAIAYSGRGNSYVLASDRGPKDSNDVICRVHEMEIVVTPGGKHAVELKLTATTLLTNETGKFFVGHGKAFDPLTPTKSRRLDPEGIRVGPRGTLFIADEFGPFLYEFDRKGKRLRSLPVPVKFQPANPGAHAEQELPPHNTVGRQPNRGFEGLAITPDGGKLFAAMQCPLIQDGALDKENKRVGHNNRLLEVDVKTGASREFVYVMDHHDSNVCEILAVNDHTFLILERDGKGGKDAAFKNVFLIDMTGATDVSGVAALPTGTLPKEIVPVKKTLFLDLLDPRFGIAAEETPEKFEGLAFGPDLPDGRRLLIVTADNDFVATVPFRVYAFAVDTPELPGYVPQVFEKGK